jgi:hypothetical protein
MTMARGDASDGHPGPVRKARYPFAASRRQEWRAVATRYEKTERSFMGVLCMAATMDWLKA